MPRNKSNMPTSQADLLLPMANGKFLFFQDKKKSRYWQRIVSRTMKDAVPAHSKLSKEAKDCMQECVTEFVAFITSEAAEISNGAKRKTINGQDILYALTLLGMENYSEVLAIYLSRYRQQLRQNGISSSDVEKQSQVIENEMNNVLYQQWIVIHHLTYTLAFGLLITYLC